MRTCHAVAELSDACIPLIRIPYILVPNQLGERLLSGRAVFAAVSSVLVATRRLRSLNISQNHRSRYQMNS